MTTDSLKREVCTLSNELSQQCNIEKRKYEACAALAAIDSKAKWVSYNQAVATAASSLLAVVWLR